MVFLVIIPGIPAALGNIIMPIQLGAPDVAFPRLNLTSFYLWVAGALLLVAHDPVRRPRHRLDALHAVLARVEDGRADRDVAACSCSGSRRSSPASTSSSRSTSSARRAWAGSSCRSTCGRSTRPRSCRCSRRRCSASRCCCSSVERFAHIGIFDPTLGGDPVLFQHFFWFYSHPAVYIMIIPGMGVISELISTFSRKPLFGYRFVAYSSVSLALLSFLVWGHHMFVSGQSRLANMVFSALTFTVGIPTRHQGLQLGRDALQGRHPAQDADALRAVVPPAVHDRRPDRPVPRRSCRSTSTSTTRTSSSRTSTT